MIVVVVGGGGGVVVPPKKAWFQLPSFPGKDGLMWRMLDAPYRAMQEVETL